MEVVVGPVVLDFLCTVCVLGGVEYESLKLALWCQEEELEAAFLQHFSLEWESEPCRVWRKAVEDE
jgi:hypothetical protein